MPDLSLGELDALVLKAYRGAGFSWGMAQEAGKAAVWLASNGLPAAEYFAALVKQIDGVEPAALAPMIKDGEWIDADRPLCPVVVGTVLSDYGLSYFCAKTELVISAVHKPAVLLPFIVHCATVAGVSFSVWIDGCEVTADLPGCSGILSLNQAPVSIQQAQNESRSAAKILTGICGASQSRSVASREDLKVLNLFAHRTYVPATEQSRVSGAGAGLTDND